MFGLLILIEKCDGGFLSDSTVNLNAIKTMDTIIFQVLTYFLLGWVEGGRYWKGQYQKLFFKI